MIEREITPLLLELFEQYPFVTVTGPRQSGKTTLCRAAFPHLEYVNLEAPNQRQFAESDPVGFLAQFDEGAVLDEIQRIPDLLSYLQVLADDKRRNGLFVLTGSEQFRLSDAISQSLAGRTALLRLLPFSLAERSRTGASDRVDDILYSGFFPRIHDQGIEPLQALGDYVETYVERDVRRIGEIRNLTGFQRFVRLCAGRVGQLANLSSLGADAGVSHTTARHWLTILEASYVVLQLPPYFANIRKRLVKSPEALLLRRGAGEPPHRHRERQATGHPPAARTAVRERGRGGGPQAPFQSGPSIQPVVLPRRPGIGVRPPVRDRWWLRCHRDQVRRHCRLRLVRLAQQGLRGAPHVSTRAVVHGGTDRQRRRDGEVVPLTHLAELLDQLDA